MTELEKHLPNILETFPKFVNLEILDSGPSKTKQRILQLYVGTAGKPRVWFRHDTEDRRGDFYIAKVPKYMTYIRHDDFKPTNRRFGLLIETRIRWWAGSKAIHLDGPLCRYTANNIIEFILFLEGYVELNLTDVGVSFLAEKLAEGMYVVNPEKSSCYDHPDVSETECEGKNNDARDSNEAGSVQGGDRGQGADGTGIQRHLQQGEESPGPIRFHHGHYFCQRSQKGSARHGERLPELTRKAFQ